MRAIAQGDDQAFACLVEVHLQPLYRYALRLCNSPAWAEDLLQETWLTVWQKAQAYKPRRGSVSTWLHRLLHNRFVDDLRKQRLSYDNEAVAWALDHNSLEQQQLDAGQARRLQQALVSLPVNQRAALLLGSSQGFSNPEIAQILGIGRRAVESLQARARRSLKSQLQESEQSTAHR